MAETDRRGKSQLCTNDLQLSTDMVKGQNPGVLVICLARSSSESSEEFSSGDGIYVSGPNPNETHKYHHLTTTLHLTLTITTAQVIETSITKNSLSKDYPHPEDHAKQIKLLLTTRLLD